eukprot:TRINITY_DN917_c0_g1_i2.p1 TRINITY_DN917_c0_g1~~TRINITY_DN917_c0_g1_i2.p1  ORF type:complete len:1062 (-),score=321.85 TRINITY_DN917_c0_g1_i2:240-3425(-)
MDESALREVEELAEQLYGERAGSREAARERLICFNTPEYFGKAIFILQHSRNACALLMAGCAISAIVVDHWNSVTDDESIAARDAIFSVLWDNGSDFPPFASTAIMEALAKIIKLGWLDDERHQQAPDMIQRFMNSREEHQILALRILRSVLQQMNKRYGGDTIARHRKIAISFRDNVLEGIFSSTIQSIQRMAGAQPENELQVTLKEDTLQLALACLEFDFIGTTPDETGIDLGTVQIPNGWRHLFEDESPPLLQLFFGMYASSPGDLAKYAMECLVQLASTRKSLFSSDRTRLNFLSMLIHGITDILRNQTNLQHAGCHHDFCRLLARLRANFQLNMLVEVDGYSDWISLVCDFTVKTFHAWQWAPNSLFYLLSVWASLIRGLPFMKPGSQHLVKDFAPKVIGAYVASRLDSVGVALEDDTAEDPLLDEHQLKVQLDSVPPITRCSYEESAAGIIGFLEPLAASLKQHLTNGALQHLPLIDGQLAWLLYVIGSVTGGRSPPTVEVHDELDGELVTRVFQLLQIHHQRLERFPDQPKTPQLEAFEMSLLHFLELFRRVYIGDQSLAKSKVYQRLGEVVGLTTNLDVLEVIVQKLIKNLNWWREETDIVKRSLALFNDVAAGYNSGKLLVKLNIVDGILGHHTVEHFAFLGFKENLSCRKAFYTTLGRILLMNENIEKFDEFMLPFDNAFRRVGSANSIDEMRTDECRDCLIGLLRDLRGIVTACNQRNSYLKFFEWIFPEYTPILHRVSEAMYDVPEVTSSLLNLVIEMVTNKNNRLNFECSSPNGILLFKECSKILTTISARLYDVDVSNIDPFKFKYKGVMQCLNIMKCCLAGNYINFGVFELYEDPCLRDSLGACLKLALNIPAEELITYPKLVKAFYGLMQVLFQYHIGQLVDLDSASFQHILGALQEGLTSTTMDVFHECCASIDHVAAFCFKYRNKTTPASEALKHHLTQEGGGKFFETTLELLFQVLLFVDSANHWALARPLLSLILVNPDVYHALSERIVRTQPADRQEKLHEAFGKLMDGVHNNLLSANREKFTHNLTTFRQSVKSFIVVV